MPDRYKNSAGDCTIDQEIESGKVEDNPVGGDENPDNGEDNPDNGEDNQDSDENEEMVDNTTVAGRAKVIF